MATIVRISPSRNDEPDAHENTDMTYTTNDNITLLRSQILTCVQPIVFLKIKI
jgi:hypothetical protein